MNLYQGRPKVAVVVVIRGDGKILLVRRSPGDFRAGEWEVPGGHVDPGETATQAAVREVKEEVGLDVEILPLVDQRFSFFDLRGTADWGVMFGARLLNPTTADGWKLSRWPEPKLKLDEHDQYMWIDPADLATMQAGGFVNDGTGTPIGMLVFPMPPWMAENVGQCVSIGMGNPVASINDYRFATQAQWLFAPSEKQTTIEILEGDGAQMGSLIKGWKWEAARRRRQAGRHERKVQQKPPAGSVFERLMKAVIDRRAHAIHSKSGKVTFGGAAHYTDSRRRKPEERHPGQIGLFDAVKEEPKKEDTPEEKAALEARDAYLKISGREHRLMAAGARHVAAKLKEAGLHKEAEIWEGHGKRHDADSNREMVRRLQAGFRTPEDVADPQGPAVGVAASDHEWEEAERLGLHREEINGVRIYSRGQFGGILLKDYLRAGGVWGAPAASQKMHYSYQDVRAYSEALKEAGRTDLLDTERRHVLDQKLPKTFDWMAKEFMEGEGNYLDLDLKSHKEWMKKKPNQKKIEELNEKMSALRQKMRDQEVYVLGTGNGYRVMKHQTGEIGWYPNPTLKGSKKRPKPVVTPDKPIPDADAQDRELMHEIKYRQMCHKGTLRADMTPGQYSLSKYRLEQEYVNGERRLHVWKLADLFDAPSEVLESSSPFTKSKWQKANGALIGDYHLDDESPQLGYSAGTIKEAIEKHKAIVERIHQGDTSPKALEQMGEANGLERRMMGDVSIVQEEDALIYRTASGVEVGRLADPHGDTPWNAEHVKKFRREEYPAVHAALGDALRVQDVEHPKVRKFLDHLAALPDDVLRRLGDAGCRIHIGDLPVTHLDQNHHMIGVRPRGWGGNDSWEVVGGVFTRRGWACVSTRGRDGSTSVTIHEVGHAIHHFLLNEEKQQADLKTIHETLYPNLDPYLRQGGPGATAGIEEMVAESFADLMMKGSEEAAKKYSPDLIEWWFKHLPEVKAHAGIPYQRPDHGSSSTGGGSERDARRRDEGDHADGSRVALLDGHDRRRGGGRDRRVRIAAAQPMSKAVDAWLDAARQRARRR